MEITLIKKHNNACEQFKNINWNNVTGGGIDYDSGSYTVTFSAGQTSMSFDVPINDDNILEDDEGFILTISLDTLPDGVTSDGEGQTIATIKDDDCRVGQD